jgi:hypothetical protein
MHDLRPKHCARARADVRANVCPRRAQLRVSLKSVQVCGSSVRTELNHFAKTLADPQIEMGSHRFCRLDYAAYLGKKIPVNLQPRLEHIFAVDVDPKGMRIAAILEPFGEIGAETD